MPVIVPRAEIYVQTQAGKNYLIRRFQRCKVTLSRSLPCDVCELVLPKLDNLKLFRENDELIVSLGNDKVGMSTLFRGYISTLSPRNEPLLGAEDFFKTFKEKRNTKYYLDTPVNIARDIIEYCGFEPVLPDTWEKEYPLYWRMQTAAEALEELSHIGWDYFCIPATKKIYFGKPYNLPGAEDRVFIYRFGLNLIDSKLEYRTATPIAKAIVYVTDTKFRGNSIRVDFPQGVAEPSKIFNLQMDFDPTSEDSRKKAEDQAKEFAQQEIAKSQVSGYRGTFKTFGNPFVRHSQKIKIEDPQKQERTGHYFIDQVVHEFSPEAGYKMEISVGGIEGGVGGTGGLVA